MELRQGHAGRAGRPRAARVLRLTAALWIAGAGAIGLGGLAAIGSGCRKPEAPAGPRGTPEAPRSVDVKVSNQGFTPARIKGQPGETLRLLFRYDPSAGECGREVVLPSQNVRVTLTEQQPVEVALSLPSQKGEVGFTCGMNMLRGAIVVE